MPERLTLEDIELFAPLHLGRCATTVPGEAMTRHLDVIERHVANIYGVSPSVIEEHFAGLRYSVPDLPVEMWWLMVADAVNLAIGAPGWSEQNVEVDET